LFLSFSFRHFFLSYTTQNVLSSQYFILSPQFYQLWSRFKISVWQPHSITCTALHSLVGGWVEVLTTDSSNVLKTFITVSSTSWNSEECSRKSYNLIKVYRMSGGKLKYVENNVYLGFC
jgi:hypothetical protein